ncbi:hypothetical protein SY83_08475 [Paenibacillus swuensis]|uniref:Uncharacterized protein n=1 Tax=Paenibacillus swuensis TaxID=1178515 RepID=A0A172TGY5_9BACL|nr:hypothetical protein [Paenibacillus swuensis]ANE46305.1 hypothetical protein SY83_08475 [Paenibacillus swuensis]
MSGEPGWRWRNHKDLIYLFIITDLVLFMILVSVWRFHSAQELINQISFGSTLASILLALVAMVYSYFQSFESSNQNRQVQQALHQISSKVDEFKEIKQELSDMRRDSKESNDHLISMLNKVTDKASKDVGSIFHSLRENGFEVSEDLEKAISAQYRKKFESEIAKIRGRFSARVQPSAIDQALDALIRKQFEPGTEVSLLEVVDLLVYQGVEYTGGELKRAIDAAETQGLLHRVNSNGVVKIIIGDR